MNKFVSSLNKTDSNWPLRNPTIDLMGGGGLISVHYIQQIEISHWSNFLPILMPGHEYCGDNIVEPLLSSHSWGQGNWPVNRGSLENNIGRGPVFSLSNISTNKCKWRKSRPMIVITPSMTLPKTKETTAHTDAMCLSTQHWLVCCTN